jgi:tetratricopeptide (TPR) repeat protein/O-antigen ligase
VTLLTAALSNELRRGLFVSWDTLVGLLLLYLLVDAIRRGWSRVLWRVLYLVGALVCVIGAVEFLAWYFGWPLLAGFQQGWPAIGGLEQPFPPTLYRIGLALANNTALSAFLALLIPPAMTIALATRDREVRTGMTLWLIAAGGITLLSLSRGGFVALGVSLPILLLGSTRDPRFRRWWSRFTLARGHTVLVAIAVVILVVVVGVGLLLTSRLAEHSSGDAVRMDLWRSAGAMFLDHPFTGVGPGVYGIELRTYRNPRLARDHVMSAHNLYLNIAAEMGIPGFLVAVWVILTLAWSWWQRWRGETPGSPGWWRLLGIGAALAGLAAQSMVDTFVESAILLTSGFFVALILAKPLPQGKFMAHKSRWPWLAAFLVMLLGAAGMAWDAWGHARFERSLALTRQGEIEDALVAVETARDRDSGMPLYTCHEGYLYGLQTAAGAEQALSMALNLYEECVAAAAVPDMVDQLNYSTLLWQAGKKDEARRITQELIEQMPLQPRAWLLNGLWAERSGDDQGAVQSYGRVLALDPLLAGSPFWIEGVRASWWDEILQMEKPADTVPWRWQALLAAGQFEEAENDLVTWLGAHSGDTAAKIGLGETLIALGRPSEAIKVLDEALDEAPSNAGGYLARSEARRALGLVEEAEQDLRKVLFFGPDYKVHLELARLALDRGEQDVALQEYARALRPQVLSQNTYVVLYGRIGWPVAVPQVTRIGYRHDAEVALEWGSLLEARGETEAAAEVYEAALNLDPFLTEVRQRLEKLGQ